MPVESFDAENIRSLEILCRQEAQKKASGREIEEFPLEAAC